MRGCFPLSSFGGEGWGEVALKSEARNPRAERRPSSEDRNPRSRAIRASAFFRPSDLTRVATTRTLLTELFARSLSAFRLISPPALVVVSGSAPSTQGCIKLRFALASAAAREIFASRSAGQPNPEGWQRVAGGRFGAAGETTTGHALRSGWHPGGMPAACVRKQSQPFSLSDQRPVGQSSGTHAGCRVR